MDWLEHGQWLGSPILTWMVAGALAFASYVVLKLFAVALAARLRKLAQRTGRRGFAVAAQVAEATRGWLLLLIAITVALDILYPGAAGAAGAKPWTAHAWLHIVTYALVGIQVALWIIALLVSLLRRSAERGSDAHPANPVMLGVLTWAVQLLVWITLMLALMAEARINITAFVASLGVGGVAVALALQNVLGDLFASISIGLDKPFEVGEFIAFGTDMGTVTKVGIKSTRISSLSGEELAISNSVLLKNLIHNYSRMQQRRVVFNFRLPFDTPRDKLGDAVARVRQIIESEQSTRFDRGALSGFGDYGLDFEFVYYVLDPSYNVYAELQQRIYLKMLALWDELGIELAVPVRKLHTADGTPSVRSTSG